MQITAIKPFPVWVGHRNQLIVKIETNEGIFGWGESGLSGREKAVVGAIEHFREFLLGKEPMRIGAIWQELYRSQYFEGGRVLLAAQSAIDIALHDIKAKALGVPVYELLGGKQREHIPTFASTAAIAGPETIEAAQALIARGWNAIRFFPAAWASEQDIFEPRESIGTTARFLTEAREAHYVDMMPHNPLGPICTAASIHFSAAVANFSWLETRANATDLYSGTPTAEMFPQMPMLDGAVYQVPDGPGLGIEVDEALLTRASFKFWEAPHLRRRDGSVTNW
jgi:L-alanine-DL-glutamate epimerase-like enolase superfamily enzyme